MRVFYFILLTIASVIMPWWLVLAFWVLYAFFVGAYELMMLGILLDAYFGYASLWHSFYFWSAVILCVGVELLRPRLAFYDRKVD